MVGHIDIREIKVGVLEKRSQNKSVFTQENYQTRVFVLESGSLRYYTGTPENREEEKGCIDLCTVLAVESVEDGLLSGKTNTFQVLYTYEIDGDPIALYVVAPNINIRDSWIIAIRAEAQKNNAKFLQRYHKGILVDGQYNCCGGGKTDEGCQQTMQASIVPDRNISSAVSMSSLGSVHTMRLSNLLVDTMMKRAQGKSAFFARENYKKRTFVLDANSLRYYSGDIRMRKSERGRIHLSCVVTVEPAELPEKYQNVFQVAYFDDYDLFRLYVVANSKDWQDKWIKTIKREAIKLGAEFLPSYHPSNYSKVKGKWECCGDINKLSEGCKRVIAQPDMKLCGADLNASVATSTRSRAQSPHELKVDCMLKKPQGKSTFLFSDTYKKRVFTLDNFALAFYSGYLEDRGELRGSIPLVDMMVVENVRDGMLEDKVNAFQVIYTEDRHVCNLYIVADSEDQRTSWVNSLKRECSRSNVSLLPRFHPGVYIKKLGHYNCCKRQSREAQGCADVTGMSLVSVRDRLNTMESIGPRHRLGTLDSVPENAVMVTDNHRSSTIPVPHSGQRRRRLAQLPQQHHEQQKQQQQQQPQQQNRQHEIDSQREHQHHKQEYNNNSHNLSGGEWTLGVANLTMSAVGVQPVNSAERTNHSAFNTRNDTTLSGTSYKQPSSTNLDISNQYSEDFESVSEVAV